MRVERRKEKQDGLTMEKQDLLPPDKKLVGTAFAPGTFLW